jgi:hypothetical protein
LSERIVHFAQRDAAKLGPAMSPESTSVDCDEPGRGLTANVARMNLHDFLTSRLPGAGVN